MARFCQFDYPRSRIHERTILMSFLGIILRVLRLEYTLFTRIMGCLYKG